MPLHPKAREIAKSGLFAGVKSFAELEKRIAAIPENKGKGDAFEVFAEGYLATQRKHDAKEVWPLNTTPLDVLSKLGLGGMDYGIDGVLQTLLGDLSAYQVKFRTGREPMTWRELSTFMGLADSPHIRSRILITNCDELPSVINERQGFFCIRGSDLDRMEASDFTAIESWLADAIVRAPRKTPLPHQQEALAAIVPTLQQESRATAIMACGTGKTLVTLWTAEQLGARKVLVLLPSLALLRQTLHEWLKETSLESLAYLCVCSDPTVKGEADEISTAQSDLDFEVSTNPETVRRFLDAPFEGTKIIFSTYQSASVIGEAMKMGETFDFGIFDEAHKTAGREGRNYGYALEDRNIPISKRLFVTATPRHYNPSKRNKEGEATVAFSMDDPEVYGEQCYALSFSRAANLGIICGYKVIISVITSDQVNDEILSRGIVEIKGDEVRARQVANQIALRDAVNQYGVGKIFTFHSTVKSAASFVAEGNEGVRTHLPEFDAFHVSGAMPTAHRERLMQEFKRINRGVMSNARCLTEGVDVPAVDMVAFLSPKKSKVDIVQAIGRAMRKSPGKEIGYVLVPLYLEQREGETLEEALARTDFEEVWDILQSLKEQDEVLAELIRDMAEAKGRGKGFDDTRLDDRLEFTGLVLNLETLRSSIVSKCLEQIIHDWDISFGKLLEFREKFGHCDVPKRYKDDPKLGFWVATQRSFKRQLRIKSEREKKLNEVGFIWEGFKGEKPWMEYYHDLIRYKQTHNNDDPPRRYIEDPTFGHWIGSQRSNRKKGILTQEQLRLLDAIGFVWDPLKKDWEDKLQELKDFKKRYGHCNVSAKNKVYKELGDWVRAQRSKYKRGVLSEDRIQILKAVGMVWEINIEWDEYFQELIKYKNEYGNCNVPSKFPKNQRLSNWVKSQRNRRITGVLEQSREKKLTEIGFAWDGFKKPWIDNYRELVEYKAVHGNTNVPLKYAANPPLGIWCSHQRVNKKKGKLPQERVRLLDEIGFIWDFDLVAWMQMYSELIKYKDLNGNCDIPSVYASNPPLGSWVNTQRESKKKGKLSQERITLLDKIGFTWSFQNSWRERYNELLTYRDAQGFVDFKKATLDKSLKNWITLQRHQFKKGILPNDYKSLLDEILFPWELEKKRSWSDFYDDLCKYKDAFGSCSVPKPYPNDPELSRWVNYQRQRKRLGSIVNEEIQLLDNIGFSWNTHSDGWMHQYKELSNYFTIHGTSDVPRGYKENPSLFTWCETQRARKKKNKLTKEQINLLESLAFIWIKRPSLKP